MARRSDADGAAAPAVPADGWLEFSAGPAGRPGTARTTRTRLLDLVRDGSPIYAWRFAQGHVWRTAEMPRAARVLERVTRAR